MFLWLVIGGPLASFRGQLASVVYERTSGVTPADMAAAAPDIEERAALSGVVGEPSPPIPATDGQALQVTVALDANL